MSARIGVLTSGGDAPGMNAAVRAVVRSAARRGCETIGFRRGYAGLIDDAGDTLSPRSVANIIQRGGSILETSRDPRFHEAGYRRRAAQALDGRGCDAVIVIGGEGSLAGAERLDAEWDGTVVTIPATIDNDVGGTEVAIGFDTACNTALEAIDRIRDTAGSLDRLFFVEVMGRASGAIALEVAIGGGAEAVVLPEVSMPCEALAEVIQANYEKGKLACIIVVAEGAHPGGARGLLQEMRERRLRLEAQPGAGPRVTILGHIQRGGNPTVRDRVLASRFGAAAVETILEHRASGLVIMRDRDVSTIPLAVATSGDGRLDPKLMQLIDVLAS